MEGDCTHTMDDQATVWLCHRYIPHHGPQKETIPDHLWPVRSAACAALDANMGILLTQTCFASKPSPSMSRSTSIPALKAGSRSSLCVLLMHDFDCACGAGFLAFGLLSLLPPLAGTALLFMTLGELAIAFSDVVIDGVVVECSRGEDQATAGSLQSICWGSQASQSLYLGMHAHE